jgi:site-specific DNA-methyltransferase (adenine-specific)
MTRTRLIQPFVGFDSIDPRMERVPLDLRDKKNRYDYLKNHITWFLKHHQNSLDTFRKTVKEMYGENIDQLQFDIVSDKFEREPMSMVEENSFQLF